MLRLRRATAATSAIWMIWSQRPSAFLHSHDKAPAQLPTMRKEYSFEHALDHPGTDPIALFQQWFSKACASKILEPNAMTLSTCSNNKPSSRHVLLKYFDDRGFVWFTNYESRKGEDLKVNPNAAMSFWWGELELSVRIEGTVEKVSQEESDHYFRLRPRASQIGAWASNQSREIESREALDIQEQETAERFKEVEVIPRPPHWGGYRLTPTRIEFWKGRHGRMHDRIVFERDVKSIDAGNLTAVSWSSPKRLQP